MAPQTPWSPTAHAFAQHQFSHAVNFWKQGWPASFQFEALPCGQARLNLTFQLPPASEVVPPPSQVFPVPPQRPTHPLFPSGCFSQESGAASKTTLPSHKKASSKQRKSYRRSVLHRAALAAPSLPPPRNGSLRQASQAQVQHLQAVPASNEKTQSSRKRPLPDSPSAPSPSNIPPLAQRIREDIHVEESEIESPDKEILRSSTFPENSSPISPCAKGLPSPTPLVFTPVLPEKQVETADSDSSWEDIQSEQDLEDSVEESEDSVAESEDSYPTIDVNCEDWAEKFTNSIRRFHESGNLSSSHQIIDELEEKCPNCERVFTPHHQC